MFKVIKVRYLYAISILQMNCGGEEGVFHGEVGARYALYANRF